MVPRSNFNLPTQCLANRKHLLQLHSAATTKTLIAIERVRVLAYWRTVPIGTQHVPNTDNE